MERLAYNDQAAMQDAGLNYMTVKTFPKSARLVPTVGQMGSTKA
jgi:hypothetical protein